MNNFFSLDKIFFESNCSTPWLLTREPVGIQNINKGLICSFSTLRCTNNTINAFFSQSCVLSTAEKEVNFDYVKATTLDHATNANQGYVGPYEYIFRADGQCRTFQTLTGNYGNGSLATCVNGQPTIQECDYNCNNCANLNLSSLYSNVTCQVFPKSDGSSHSFSALLMLILLINIF